VDIFEKVKVKDARDSESIVLAEEEQTLKTMLHRGETTQTRDRGSLRVKRTSLVIVPNGQDHKSGTLSRYGARGAGKMTGYLVLDSSRLPAPEAVQPANCTFGCARIDLGLDSGQTLVR
jgi:hypothetical protein